MVTKQDIKEAYQRLGVVPGDIVLTHSSFKSLGPTENGADTVISGIFEAVGPEGTVVFPTLCSNDWYHLFENWHLDAPSDVGYLTNYFRKLPGALRSNQATHSVAAIGKYASYLTETHGQTGHRYGVYGVTPFAKDSPWEKMYHMDTKIIFLGVPITKCTMRHYVEYCFVDDQLTRVLEKTKSMDIYERFRRRIWYYASGGGVWPHVNAVYVQEQLEPMGKIHRTQCGNAELIMVSAKDFAEMTYSLLEKRDINALVPTGEKHMWHVEDTMAWLEDIDRV